MRPPRGGQSPRPAGSRRRPRSANLNLRPGARSRRRFSVALLRVVFFPDSGRAGADERRSRVIRGLRHAGTRRQSYARPTADPARPADRADRTRSSCHPHCTLRNQTPMRDSIDARRPGPGQRPKSTPRVASTPIAPARGDDDRGAGVGGGRDHADRGGSDHRPCRGRSSRLRSGGRPPGSPGTGLGDRRPIRSSLHRAHLGARQARRAPAEPGESVRPFHGRRFAGARRHPGSNRPASLARTSGASACTATARLASGLSTRWIPRQRDTTTPGQWPVASATASRAVRSACVLFERGSPGPRSGAARTTRATSSNIGVGSAFADVGSAFVTALPGLPVARSRPAQPADPAWTAHWNPGTARLRADHLGHRKTHQHVDSSDAMSESSRSSAPVVLPPRFTGPL